MISMHDWIEGSLDRINDLLLRLTTIDVGYQTPLRVVLNHWQSFRLELHKSVGQKKGTKR